MTENVEDLILEHLKMLRNDVKAQGIKMDEQFESVLGSVPLKANWLGYIPT